MTQFNLTPPAAFWIERPLGILHISGETRLDLLDRMSTQRLRQLQPGSGAATVLTTDIGRTIDRLLVYAADDHLLVLTGGGNGDNIARYLMRFVFFNDDFHLKEQSQTSAVLGLYGSEVEARLHAAGFPSTDLPLHGWRAHRWGEIPLTLHKTDPVAGGGFLLLVAREHLTTLTTALAEAGITTVSADAFEHYRIAAGLPLLGREIAGDYIPLETGLWGDISFNKGCYIGQEIIARMESRGQLARQLVRLSAAAPITPGTQIEAAGKAVGTITSASQNLALGYVKTKALESAQPLSADGHPLTLEAELAAQA